MVLGGLGCALSSQWEIYEEEPPNKFSDSKEHLDQLKIVLNVAEVIAVQDNKCTQSYVNGSAHTQC